MINSEFLDGLAIEAARRRWRPCWRKRGIGARKVNYRLRDWLISRQRYWGCRSRSSTARRMASCRCRSWSFRVKLPDDAIRQAWYSSGPSSDVEALAYRQVRPAGSL